MLLGIVAVIVVCAMRRNDDNSNDGTEEVAFDRSASVPMSVLQQSNPQVTSFRDDQSMRAAFTGEGNSTRGTVLTASSGGSEYAVCTKSLVRLFQV